MKTKLNKIDFEALEEALIGTLKKRKRIYEAHRVAINAFMSIIGRRLDKKLHTFTIQQVMIETGCTIKSARSAITKLEDAGVLILVKDRKAYGNNKSAGKLWSVGEEFITRLKPQTIEDAYFAIIENGGTLDAYLLAKDSLYRDGHKRVSGEMIIERYEEQEEFKLKQLMAISRRGGKL